ncbi:MAG: STAS domain-containing protein [Gammaproteobacteria bacterium]|nr:STAS domain-containing protein [Gammaproteobacteria bacterium]
MTVKLTTTNGNEAVISIVGRFDFSTHGEFRHVLDALRANKYAKYTVDMGAVDDMDSAALGMLLLLRDTVGGDKSEVQLVRCRMEVREMLKMANFQDLFRIV